jgi:GNAT superfamily N-acetyltransferase
MKQEHRMATNVSDIITLAGIDVGPGLIFRHFRGPADYPGLTEVNNISEAADGEEWVATVGEIAHIHENVVNYDPARDLIIAEVDGHIVGAAFGSRRQENDGLYRFAIVLHLVPAWRGRGLRRAMLRWLEARLREVAAGLPPGAPKAFALSAPEQAEDLRALLASEGYHIARYFNRMARPLADPIPDFPLPAGLELRPVTPDQYRAIWDATNEAFRDHWGFSPRPDEYFQWWLNEPTFNPALWQVAWDVATGEIAGQVQTFIDTDENEAFGRRRGYTETISVRRPYRRRGLARAMIVESLRALKAQGMTESALNVDSDSPTGAMRVYTDCGFRVEGRQFAYRKPLDVRMAR